MSPVKEDALLAAMQDPQQLELLYDLWRIVQACPSKAAAILMQFKDVEGAAKTCVKELQTTVDGFERLKNAMPALEGVSRSLKQVSSSLLADGDQLCNRVERLTKAAGDLEKLKKSGALDLLLKLQGG